MGRITALIIGSLFVVVGVWVLLTNVGALYGWGGVALGLAFCTYGTFWGKGGKQRA